MEIYNCTSINIDIICKSYDRNPFVQKNENNGRTVYNFKFRGEEVCITIPLQPGTLCVEGNGRKIWCKEATCIYKYKRLHPGELQKPGESQKQGALPETGENKKQLVPEEEFSNCFAIPYAYGTYNWQWPHKTILLYKYSSNATAKYQYIPEDTWKRIDNKPGQHAELIMIEDLEEIQDYLTIQPDDYEGSDKAILSVEVILSYSPCYNCAQELCHVKKRIDKKMRQSKTRNRGPETVQENLSALSLTTEVEEVEKIQFKITFSNFYEHTRKHGTGNIEGLKNLMKTEIKLDIFKDENWDYFFNAAGLVTERLCRQRRERDDKKILQYLERLVAFDKMQEALEATKEDLQNNDLL